VPVRVLERLDELYAIGGGTRLAYSPEEDAAHELAAGWMQEAGLEVGSDEAGNLFGSRGRARVWSGSHLDTVPNGGKFDGALGVVAAIEAAERLDDVPLAVVAFRAEESGPMGSRRLVELPGAFLELHIEQGPTLERLGRPLGIVTAIAGQARGSVTFEGRAGHAGTTPMDERVDALVEAAEFVLRVRDSARDGTVATVGALEVEPGATNVVPARVTASVDARAPTAEQLEALIQAIGFEPAWRQDPIEMTGPPLDALRAVLAGAPELVSGAGHDAMVLAAAGVPTAMLFVRSLNGGISHSPDELSADDDIELAVDALTAALERLAFAVEE
jgi:allantoate deiminase